jgi:aminoglycoside phosphotransferase (APT) family kinase protein
VVPVWEAEIVVDEALARRLLSQFPELEVGALRPLGYGWDYTIWVVDERYAFRFPRRQIGIPGTEREIAVLPKLAPLLPVPVPAPLYVGQPTDEYPWPFFGSMLLPGKELSEAALGDGGRLAVALELAEFLRSLHAVELDEPLPVDVNGRADMTLRVPMAREVLSEVGQLGIWQTPPSVTALLDEAEGLGPPQHLGAVVHGDLHFRQVLAEDGRVTGVIDWVDVCRSDPAIDLSLYWSLLEPLHRPDFLETYGDVSEEQLLRARLLAFSLCAAVAWQAHGEGLTKVEREAVAGLDRAAL